LQTDRKLNTLLTTSVEWKTTGNITGNPSWKQTRLWFSCIFFFLRNTCFANL